MLTGVLVSIFKKGDQRMCSNFRGITILSLPGKVYFRVLEKRLWFCKKMDQLLTSHAYWERSGNFIFQSTCALWTGCLGGSVGGAAEVRGLWPMLQTF